MAEGRPLWTVSGDDADPILTVVCIEEPSGRPRLVVEGEVCLASGPALGEAIERYARTIDVPVPVDLSAVSFMDAAGLSALMRATFAGDGDGGRLTILRPSLAVRRIAELTSTEWLLRGDGPPGPRSG